MFLCLRTAPRDPTESTGSMTNTSDPLQRCCCEKLWKSSYWRSPLSDEIEPPTTEENGRDTSQGGGRLGTGAAEGGREGRRGWRCNCH
ncbi:hypothetical protein ACFX19_004782 [Malus domestica]